MTRKSTTAPRDNGAGLTNEQRINLLLQQGLDTDTIFFALSRSRDNLMTNENANERISFAKKYGVPIPSFDKTARQRLMEQIRKCKSKYRSDTEGLDILDSMKSDDGSPRHISEIPLVNIPRFSLGIPSLDEMLGQDPINKQIGCPQGATIILGAPKGVGKTRISVKIAAHVGDPKLGKDEHGNEGVLFFQNEEKVDIFRTRAAKDWKKHHNIEISSSDNLLQQCAIINRIKPRLIIIDSIQDTQQARYSSGIRGMLTTYKAIAESSGVAFWLISHVNAKGGIKGGTYAGHKVDIEILAKRMMNPTEFCLEIPEKNRFGRTNKVAWFMHTDDGIVSIDKERERGFDMGKAKLMLGASVPLGGSSVLTRGDTSSLPAGGLPVRDEDGEEE